MDETENEKIQLIPLELTLSPHIIGSLSTRGSYEPCNDLEKEKSQSTFCGISVRDGLTMKDVSAYYTQHNDNKDQGSNGILRVGLNERLIDEGMGRTKAKRNSEGKTLWGRSWKLDDSTWCVWVLLEFSLSKAAFYRSFGMGSFRSCTVIRTWD